MGLKKWFNKIKKAGKKEVIQQPQFDMYEFNRTVDKEAYIAKVAKEAREYNQKVAGTGAALIGSATVSTTVTSAHAKYYENVDVNDEEDGYYAELQKQQLLHEEDFQTFQEQMFNDNERENERLFEEQQRNDLFPPHE